MKSEPQKVAGSDKFNIRKIGNELGMNKNTITELLPISEETQQVLASQRLLDPTKLYYYTEIAHLKDMFSRFGTPLADQQNIMAGCILARYSSRVYFQKPANNLVVVGNG